MIETHDDLQQAARHLHGLQGLIEKGHLEFKAAFKPHYDELQTLRDTAVAEGFLPEEDPHEIDGRHLLTLTWHF